MSKISATGRITAVCAAAVLLTGCGGNPGSSQNINGGDLHDQIEVQEVRETDISKRFPEYFKYCFGEDATYTYLRTDEDDDSDYYELTYHDHTGALRTREYYTFPYGEEQAEVYPNAEEYYAAEMEYLASDEMDNIFRREFSQEVLEKYLDGHWEEKTGWVSDTESLILLPVVGVYIGQIMILSDDPVGQRLAHAHIEPGTGWQVCTADWKTLASDEQWYLTFSLWIPADSDADAYTEKIHQIIADYQSCKGGPQSFSFSLRQGDGGSDIHTVNLVTYIMGEEIDLSEMGEDYHPMKEHAKKLVEKHQND